MATAVLYSRLSDLLLHFGYFLKRIFLENLMFTFFPVPFQCFDYSVNWFYHFNKQQLALSSGKAKTKATRWNHEGVLNKTTGYLSIVAFKKLRTQKLC